MTPRHWNWIGRLQRSLRGGGGRFDGAGTAVMALVVSPKIKIPAPMNPLVTAQVEEVPLMPALNIQWNNEPQSSMIRLSN